MRKQFILLVVCLLFKVLIVNAQPVRYADTVFTKAIVTRGILYSMAEKNGNDELTSLYFDFYEPAGDTLQARPLVITVFGGAYVAGSRDYSDMEAYCERLALHGYAAASIDYRLMSVLSASASSIIREMFLAAQDVSASIRYFKRYANEYRIDTNNIFLLGNSAGTIAILHELFIEEDERPAETFITPAWNSLHSTGFAEYSKCSSHVSGAVAQWGGVLDLNFIDSAECVPLCLIHGTADETVPFDSGYCYSSSFSFLLPYVYGSAPIADRLSTLGFNDYEFHPIQGEEHAFYISSLFQLIDEKFDICFKITHDFLLKHLDFSWHNVEEPVVDDNSIENADYDKSQYNFSVFPNPSSGIINFHYTRKNSEPLEIQVFDVYGKMSGRFTYNAEYSQINLSDYSPGIYFMKAIADSRVISVTKIVIN